eukprot:gnl/MRDRNA2_/MRDRNA2_82269_c0_seq2.p1 gnl/MRDRNA2_/MRDRNA2_82269_c0~~gnl/MRDRNA2_/MRDRNA2_82269_c0_seq2.p1  ORF type:complete len:224 (-),score=29.34 gnl/MRDRNA2_/MRDRNA2_82269_c0_seq2:502-1173(-)
MFRRLLHKLSSKTAVFNEACAQQPYLVAGVSSAGFLVSGDILAQRFTAPHDPWDSRRTLSMATWGLVWYGGPQQFLWIRLYPSLIGRGTSMQAAATSVADCVVNQLFAYVPCFYMLTGAVKGQTPRESLELLRKEYLSACLGQAGFWLPVQYLNFRYVPVHLQTFVVSTMNIINKTWLSWLSNRDRVKQRHADLEFPEVPSAVPSEVGASSWLLQGLSLTHSG